jgi:WD40 repeat protein
MALYRIALIAFSASLSCYSAVVAAQCSMPAFAYPQGVASGVVAPLADPTWKPGTVDYLEIPAEIGGNSLPVRSLAFTPDGQFLVSGGVDKTIKIWNVEARSLVQTLRPSPAQEVVTVALSSDGQTLASGSIDGTVRLWNWKTGELLHTLLGHSSIVTSVVFSPNGQTLASGSGDKMIYLWKVSDGSLDRTIATQQFIQTLAFSPTDNILASAGVGMSVDLWNGSTGKLVRSLGRYKSVIYAIAFSPDGQSLAFSSDACSPDSDYCKTLSMTDKNTLRLWNLQGRQIGKTFTGHTDYIGDIAFSPSGRTLISGSLDKTVKVWDVPTGSILPGTAIQEYLEGNRRILAIAYRPDGKAFALGSGDGSIKIFISKE